LKISKLLITLTFCLITIQISAQFSFGVRGGFIRAWEDYGEAELPDDAKIHVDGFQISALTYFALGEHFQIGAEPGYTQRGAACYPRFIIFNNDTKFLVNYLEIPMMISSKFTFFKEKISITGKLGYGPSFITSAFREVTRLSGDEPPTKIKLDVNDSSELKRWDHGMYGGLGVSLSTGLNRLFLETVYYRGLTDVDPNNASKNRSIQLGLGYWITL